MDFTFLTAFTIGLLGLTHCLGMCGGIVGALDAGIGTAKSAPRSKMAFHLAYNTGRIASYCFAGILAGLLGSLAATASYGNAVPIGRLIAGLMMIALGLYLAGWWQIITSIEKIGQRLWSRIEPISRQFLPVETPVQALGLGLVWGWLPCGLVYSALVLAMASASPAQGAWVMFGFGLGTLPALLSFGLFATALTKWVRQPMIRQLAGLIIVLFGVYTFVTAFDAHHGRQHAQQGSAVDDL